MKYNEIWRRLAKVYDEAEAKAITRVLAEDLFGLSTADILCGDLDRLPEEDAARLSTAVDRLERMEPVQYVTGKAPFMERVFHVEPGVLVPRPETEQLCRLAIDGLSAASSPDILDIGTGSGCIAITLALDIPDSRVSAWDISGDALRIAAANAKNLGAKVEFLRQDALNPPSDENRWDAIVSNPPYICDGERKDMQQNVLDYEPHKALFVPDDDPLLFYRSIASYAASSLKNGGILLFEINALYAKDTEDMLHGMGFEEIRSEKDMFGKPRNTICRKR